MAALTTIPYVNGAPASNVSGDVQTIDALTAIIGAKADNKLASTDTTPVSVIALLKQLSASIQALAATISGGNLKVDIVEMTAANADGVTTSSNSTPVTQSGFQMEIVAASQAGQVMGVGGAVGNRLYAVWVLPQTLSPGAVSVKDGGGAAMEIWKGGASSVSDIRPFPVVLNTISLAGGWSIITGADVKAIAIGDFT